MDRETYRTLQYIGIAVTIGLGLGMLTLWIIVEVLT
jgi:hypothetical protein